MARKFAIAYTCLFDHETTIEFVEHVNEISALKKGLKIIRDEDDNSSEWIDNMPNIVDEVKKQFVNCDVIVEIKEITV